jgi:tRNA-specific 2-thiouridylase
MSSNKKVICAMSGGIDSSVAAALLKKGGFNVIGVFMKFWSESKFGVQDEAKRSLAFAGSKNRCCSPEAETRARQVASVLKIPFYVFNFEKEFKKRVVDYFVKEYREGRTPNPCVVCNKQIKFGLLLNKALSLEADYIATGHYARKCESTDYKLQTTNYRLFRGRDKTKDQSYFLWQLSQDQLKHILFPLGDYTKIQVKNLAKKFKLPVLDISESQEICFINTNLNDFLKSRIRTKKGDVITTQGKKIGFHQGLPFYTIGQRKGIELSGGPFYVVKKDFKNNNLIVAPSFDNKALYKKTLIAKRINWISDQEPKLPLKIKAQIRYGHKAITARVTETQPEALPEQAPRRVTLYKLTFSIPQRAITPGQSVVFYSPNNQELLGGGIIKN